MKLYTFKTSAWHVKFFNWLFDVNPTNRYKTMCPYFWTYVLVFLFLPLILLVKIFGKSGTKFLNWVKDFKINQENKAIAHLKKLCTDPNLSAESAYKIKKSKCWKKHQWSLDYDIETNVKSLSDIHYKYLCNIKIQEDRERDAKRQERSDKYEEIKEYKWFPYVAYTVTFGLLGIVMFAIIYGGYQGAMAIDWTWLGKWTLITLCVLAAAFVLYISVYGIIKYVIMPFFKWISCVKLPRCGICENIKAFFSLFKYLWMPIKYILIGIVKFFAIIGDMIYSTYKKKCPLITWEDK